MPEGRGISKILMIDIESATRNIAKHLDPNSYQLIENGALPILIRWPLDNPPALYTIDVTISSIDGFVLATLPHQTASAKHGAYYICGVTRPIRTRLDDPIWPAMAAEIMQAHEIWKTTWLAGSHLASHIRQTRNTPTLEDLQAGHAHHIAHNPTHPCPQCQCFSYIAYLASTSAVLQCQNCGAQYK
jgi:hypothetical protein